MEEKIIQYLRYISFEKIQDFSHKNINILGMTPGAYNLNYHISVNGFRFIFRINIRPQSGLQNQIEYEFNILKYLEKYNIAPKVYFMDNSKRHFEYDILIEEYLEGEWTTLYEQDMLGVSNLLAKLHSIEPLNINIIEWNNPLINTYELVHNDLLEYSLKQSADRGVIKKVNKILNKLETTIINNSLLFIPDSINHTDVAIDNIIKNFNVYKLIDWEKPRFDDSSYDICCFLSEPAQLWCTNEVISENAKEIFIENYLNLTRKDRELFLEKVKIRQPLISLHWILWGMNRLCDLIDKSTAIALEKVHSIRLDRWKRVADPNLLNNVDSLVSDLAK
jgi:thiamine kinase-like enzyme